MSIAAPEWMHGQDRCPASYDRSQLQAVLFGPVHDAVVRYARRHVPHPGRILDVGCGTGRLPTRLAFAYRRAHVVGIDAAPAMIERAIAAPALQRARFAAARAAQLPFADGVFDLVTTTLSVSHWRDKDAAFAEIIRLMAPGATLVAADVCPDRPGSPLIGLPRRVRPALLPGLPALIAAAGLHVDHVEPIRSVAVIADAVLVAAQVPARSGGSQRYRAT